ncbi:MAG: DUF222 domain-containing protein, partial [Actinomycetota bacterium]
TMVHRLPHMPLIAGAFRGGELAESAVRALAEAWSAPVADAFAQSEAMLLGWAQKFPYSDFKDLLDVWLAHADPDQLAADSNDQHERRQLYVSKMLEGVGKLDGILDPRIAIEHVESKRQLDQATAGETLFGPTLPKRRTKRNRPKVFATIELERLVGGTGAGMIDTHLDHHTVRAETIRRLACDAGIHRFITGPLGTVVDHGRECPALRGRPLRHHRTRRTHAPDAPADGRRRPTLDCLNATAGS